MASFLKGLGRVFFGDKDRFKKISNYTPQQEQDLLKYSQNPIQNQPLYQAGQSFLQNTLQGGQGQFDAMQAPYIRQFNERTVPQLANQFAGMGTGSGSLNSSGFRNAALQAGKGLSETLAAQQSQAQFQAAPLALGYAQQPYQNQLGGLGAQSFTNRYQPGNTGLLGGLAQGAIGAAAGAFGGGLGAQYGSSLGNSLFNQGNSTGFNAGLGFPQGGGY